MGERDENCVSRDGALSLQHAYDAYFYRVTGVAEMAALGMGLSRNTFTDASRYGYGTHVCF